MKKDKSVERDKLLTRILFVALIVGLIIFFYPMVSNWWNDRVTSKAVATYDAAVANLVEDDYSAYFEAAEEYNAKLAEIGSASALLKPEIAGEEYWELLDVTGTGVMGYITIEKIGVQLPIYHGTDSGVLQVAAGHLQGSSLPVGGESTHAVISAHRGLPSAKLFTDLDDLEVGDTFTITILGEVFTYEVDKISIVLPSEAENLYIEEGKDYVTLMTCTPYGINSHRLLVRGTRIDSSESKIIYVTADAYKVDSIIVAPFIAIPILFVLLIVLLVTTHRKKSKKRKKSDNRRSE